MNVDKIKLFTHLTEAEKAVLRAEVALLFPEIVKTGRSKTKYENVAFYLLEQHNVLSHQTRDLFSAGSVANVKNDAPGKYIVKSLNSIEPVIAEVARNLPDELIVKYWHCNVAPEQRITKWLSMADSYASDWKPSECLFTDINTENVINWAPENYPFLYIQNKSWASYMEKPA
jgi:hypothetical protein